MWHLFRFAVHESGRLSADVAPQPDAKPMILNLSTAVLSMLGTQFEVDAELASTSLNVSEALVRLRRFSDGRVVEVPDRHLVIADDDTKDFFDCFLCVAYG